ncbi:MAG: hypothetical protein KAR42_08875 [candidate division Zixibacteria bacterium]|nr:hypothetical protein [candidate division Zixibacteria bacterium]
MVSIWKKQAGVLLLALFVLTGLGIAQDDSTTGWKTSMVFDFTTTQTAYSDSWDGGEAGALSWVSNLNATAEKQLSPSFDLKSTLKLSFGQTLSQKFDDTDPSVDTYWEKPVKSTDLIDWENVGRITKNWVVDPYVAFRLESQFLDAKVANKKLYLNPVLLTESAGIARKLYSKDKNEIISRLGFAIRQMMQRTVDSVVTVDGLDTTTAYSTSSTTLHDAGLESVTDVKFVFSEDLQWTSKLTLYKAFSFSDKDAVKGTDAEDYWKAIDVNWENRVTASITKIVSVNFYTQILYDKQISVKGRFKETLGIGITFKLM